MADRIPDEVRTQIVADVQAGQLSCRAIGRKYQVSHAIVSKIAKQEGVAWDRTAQTAAATAHAKFDAKAARADAIQRLYGHAVRASERLTSPYTFIVTSALGAQFVTTDEPPAKESKDFLTSMVSALGEARRLEAHDAADEAQAGKTMVNDLFGALGMVYHQIIAEEAAAEAVPVPAGGVS